MKRGTELRERNKKKTKGISVAINQLMLQTQTTSAHWFITFIAWFRPCTYSYYTKF